VLSGCSPPAPLRHCQHFGRLPPHLPARRHCHAGVLLGSIRHGALRLGDLQTVSSFQGRLLNDAVRILDEQRAMLAEAASNELDPDQMLVLMAEFGRRNAEARNLLAKIGARIGLPTGARARILRYLTVTMGKVVDKEELSGVSGIYEWARRVRELRVEEGWPISSNENRADLKPGQYVLEAAAPDLELRERWQTANRVRRGPGTAPERLLEFLRSNRGRAVSQDELFYVSQDHDFEEIIKTLVKQKLPIRSSLDDPALKPGQYRLDSEG
jgi:hypothetical protein